MGLIQLGGYYVNIPNGRKFKFPNCCIVCNQEATDTKVKIHGNPVGYYGLWVWLLRMGKKIEVPAHQSCGNELRSSIISRTLLLFILGVCVLVLTIHYDWSRWVMIGVSLLFLLFPILWQLKNAPPFEFEFDGDVYEFRFSNSDYANEFAKLNKTNVLQN